MYYSSRRLVGVHLLVAVLAALTAMAWSAPLADAGTPDPDVTGWPMESRDVFHSGTTTNALGPKIVPGPLWSAPTKAYGGPVIGNGKIFYWGMNDAVVAADPSDGSTLWATNAGAPVLGYRGFAYDTGRVFASHYNGYRVLDADSGSLLGAISSFWGWFSPTVKGGRAYATDINSCRTYEFNAVTFGMISMSAVPNECTNGPGVRVKGDTSYIANGAGYLTAIYPNGAWRFSTRLYNTAYV